MSRVRVLDPACGSGNFLYVTLEHLKRLEGEVFNTLDGLGQSQGRLEYTGHTVDPHQMLGLESNPRAARIADAVLWIGYLQWHFRTRGNIDPPQPVLRDYHNIEARDAVLAWDRVEFVNDEKNRPVTRWDGRTTKPHPVTGEEVPDESAQVPLERYLKPRKAEWPEADFVIGNPPFIGAGAMRRALGDGYVEALRQTYPEVAESSDYVMYWWHTAAGLARAGKIERFGLITTNSIRQTFNRRVLEPHLGDKKPLSLVFAIPDHPWVDSSDGAAVRIAMTVGEAGERPGVLQTVQSEQPGLGEGLEVVLAANHGKLHANLRIGANIAGALPLRANQKISSRGVQLFGAGFIVDPAEAAQLGLGRIPGLERHIREYRHGRDLTQTPRGVKVIDLFGLEAEQVRQRFPEVYQWVLERVKPQRDLNNRATYRDNWWIFGEPRRELRPALKGLFRFISTVETSKHRFFVFLDHSILPDNMLVNIALDDAFWLGILSSRIHVAWALAVGGTLDDRPRYNKTRCFETFPLVDVPEQQRARIRDLGEQLDAHRKSRQHLYPDLTITGMYNVLQKMRTGEELTPDDKTTHEQGLVSVLGQLHDELDKAVLEAYGWSDLASALVGKPGGTTPTHHKTPEQAEAEDTLLERIVTLNAQRAAEEARGVIHWLRPQLQSPEKKQARQEKLLPELAEPEELAAELPGKRQWPKTLPDQVRAIRATLAEQPSPVTAEQVARTFTRAQSKRIAELLETLVTFGKARLTDDQRYISG
ncbi:MAG: DNA methyltransferase [Bryobacterales bacterium]